MTLTLAVPAAAEAAVTVNTTGDPAGLGCTGGPCSLRQAIAASAAGDTINFAPGVSGAITLTGGVLLITQSVNIAGPGAGNLTIDGNGKSTVFDIAPSGGANQDVTISGLTITGGTAATNGGGILTNDVLRSLTLSGDRITGNQVSIDNPAASSGGGGVYVNGGTLTVSGSTIDHNSVTLTGSGSGSDGGGGLYDNGGTITVSGSTVSNNTVDQAASSGSSGGGGIYSNGGDVDVTTTTMQNNGATVHAGSRGSDGGGAIYSNGGQVSLGDATVGGNTFTLDHTSSGRNGGGGVYNNGGDSSIVLSSVDANNATVTDDTGLDGGGGLFSNGGQIGVFFSSMSANTAFLTVGSGSNGGGAILDDGVQSIYQTSTFSSNSVVISGTGAPSLENGGGAIRSFGSSTANNLTVAGNRIISGLGGGIFSDAAFALKNTIIANNTATSKANCAGSFSSSGFNLESANTCGFAGPGDLINTDPKLGPRQNNGGPTSTQALLAGSPAIDTGSCTDFLGSPLTTDQRGVPRPQPAGGKCDIGAFELVPATPPPPAPPAAVPGVPTAIGSTGASFTASVNPQGQATTVVFQFGIDARFRPGNPTGVIYDQSTPPQTLPADSVPHTVSVSASGLVPNALYHVRLVATNATGTTVGPDQTFTTPPGPAPPPPVLGRSVNAKPVSGQVFVLVGTKLVPLTEATRLASGTVVDAREGSLQLTAATARGHKRETGTFSGAIFRVTQLRAGASRGMTILSLVENAFAGAPSYALCKAHKAGQATAAALSTRTLQLLHASAHGKFRTRGRYSAATVRGTKWTVADRCDGTLTHDITDSVVVSDFVHHKTVILHAGKSYLARARNHK
jgi:hypothetical protein